MNSKSFTETLPLTEVKKGGNLLILIKKFRFLFRIYSYIDQNNLFKKMKII